MEIIDTATELGAEDVFIVARLKAKLGMSQKEAEEMLRARKEALAKVPEA